MRTAVSRLRFERVATLADALQRLQDDPLLRPLAGCTDVYVEVNAGTLRGDRFLDLWRLRERLGRIELRDGFLAIGALATYTDVNRSALVAERLPMLQEAARQVGGLQIQNRGTIGGNVANGSPAGDTLPVFAAAGATVVLASGAGERRVPFTEFYTGYRVTARQGNELITAIEVPPADGTQRFRKVGTRAAQAISKVVLAGIFGAAPRLAIGSVAPTVLRLARTEEALAAGLPTADVLAVLDGEIAPIDDLRSTARYRRRVARNVLGQWLAARHVPF